ncbi:Brp/Blh family beta-carotene 15,15'-dioxygenase [Catalinimonas sp. 4WD22]|uniref:Brp/Blh family beta-carotene 15,15'-dioxygenase n=1 Tax=Catalinimonas locisalis TaxID=3133978 RepID=UPI0031014AA0
MQLSSPKKLNSFLLSSTLISLVILYFVQEIPFVWQLSIFVLLMLATGIPHGAVDHIVFQHVEERSGKVKISYIRFFLFYLGIIAGYALLWILLPQFCLLVFLLMSFYHFGQSQLYYIRWEEKSIFKILLYVSWGCLIIGEIIFFNYEASAKVLEGIVVLPEMINPSEIKFIILVLGLLTLGILTVARLQHRLSSVQLAFEICSIILLTALFHLAPLLIAFAIYFGLWHSLKAIQAELIHFGQQCSMAWFYRKAWPFSALSFVGIGLLFLIAGQLEAYISYYMLFFIAISVLTMPHMYYMQKLYQNPDKQEQ